MSTNITDIDENNLHRYISVMSPNQCRAARAWLGWSQKDLAERSGVSLSTLRDFEGNRRTPIKNNLSAIEDALKATGIRFTFADDGKATGIAIAKNS